MKVTECKTLFSRMGNIKVGKFVDDETGESLSDVESVLGKIGISLRDKATGQFRDFGDVLDEVGEKWKTLDSLEKNATATALGGVRQRENVLVLFENYNKALGLQKTALESSGTAMEKYTAYEESLEGQTKKMIAVWEEFMMGTNAQEYLVDVVKFLKALGELINMAGGLKTIFAILLAITINLKWKAITKGVKDFKNGFLEVKDAIKNGDNALKAFTATSKLFQATTILGIGLIVGALIGFIAYTSKAQERTHEALTESIGELNKAKDKVQEIKDKISELNEQINGVGILKITDSKELSNLQLQREELEAQLALAKELEAVEARKASKKAKKAIYSKTGYGMTKSEVIQNNKVQYDFNESEVSRIKSASYLSEADKARQISILREEQQKLRDNSIELASALSEEADGLDLTEEKSKILHSQIKNLVTGTMDWVKTSREAVIASNELYKGFTSLDNSATQLNSVTLSLKENTKVANDGYKDFKTISDLVNKKLHLTIEEMSELIKRHPELADKIKLTTDGWTLESSAMDIVEQSMTNLQSAYLKAQQAMNSMLESGIKNRLEKYGIELEAIKSFADALNAMDNHLATTKRNAKSQSDLGIPHAPMITEEEASDLKIMSSWGKAKETMEEASKALKSLSGAGLGKVESGSKSSGGSRPESPDILKLEIDRYAELNAKISETENQINRLRTAREDYNAESQSDLIISNLNEEIELNKQLAQQYNDKAWEQKKQRNDLSYFLTQNGFDISGGFDSTNIATNYATRIKQMYDYYNSMPNETDSDKDKRSAYKQLISDIENGYKEILSLNTSIYDTEDKITEQQRLQIKNAKTISDQKKSDYENTIKDLNFQLDLLDDIGGKSVGTIQQKLSLLDKIQEEAHREAERLRAEDPLRYTDDSTEIQELKKTFMDAEKSKYEVYQTYFSKLTTAINKELEEIGEAYDKQTKSLDAQIEKTQQLVSLEEKRNEAQEQILETQRDIQKELESSKLMKEYLDEDTRKLLFNDKDYDKLSTVLKDVSGDVDSLYKKYQRDLNRLNESNMYLASSITAEYERQLELKMKEYETAKADLDIAKKKQQLNNVLAERNVRMLIGGQWQWVANSEDVLSATNELTDAQYEKDKIARQTSQQKSINSKEAKIDNLENEKNRLAKNLELASDKIKSFAENLEQPTDSIETILNDLSTISMPGLESVVSDLGRSLERLDIKIKGLTGGSGTVTMSLKEAMESDSFWNTDGSRANGGIMASTGLYSIHGQPNRPELALNNAQATNLHNFIKGLGGGDYKSVVNNNGKSSNVNIDKLILQEVNNADKLIKELNNLAETTGR